MGFEVNRDGEQVFFEGLAGSGSQVTLQIEGNPDAVAVERNEEESTTSITLNYSEGGVVHTRVDVPADSASRPERPPEEAQPEEAEAEAEPEKKPKGAKKDK